MLLSFYDSFGWKGQETFSQFGHLMRGRWTSWIQRHIIVSPSSFSQVFYTTLGLLNSEHTNINVEEAGERFPNIKYLIFPCFTSLASRAPLYVRNSTSNLTPSLKPFPSFQINFHLLGTNHCARCRQTQTLQFRLRLYLLPTQTVFQMAISSTQ